LPGIEPKLDLRAAENDCVAVPARCGKFLLVVVLVLSTGAHWAALQTVAWTTMLVANNLRTQPVTQAVSHTFDGEHLCPLCKAIAAAKKSEKKSEAVSPTLKLEFPPVAGKFVLISPRPSSVFSPAKFSADSSFPKPPVPPPRRFSV
jgi:hypothetical protein